MEHGTSLGTLGVRAAYCRFRLLLVNQSESELRALQTLRDFGCRLAGWLALLVSIALVGCRTAAPPPVNFKQPGWTVHTGQAVWHLPNSPREIAGEVLVATRTNGQSFVQFSKNPFPLVVGRSTSQSWAVEFPPQNKHYSARGTPPKRIIWLWLPRLLAGRPPPRNWSWHQDANGWQLKDPANGESLEGYFTTAG